MKRRKIVSLLLVVSMSVVSIAFSSVGEPSMAKSYSLNRKKLELNLGKSFKLKVKGGKSVKWSVKNKKIATVTKKGMVKAKAVGKTVVCAKVKGKTLKCKVTVSYTDPEKKVLDYIDYMNNGMLDEMMGCIDPKVSKPYSGLSSIFGKMSAFLTSLMPMVSSENEHIVFYPRKTTYSSNGKKATVIGISERYSANDELQERQADSKYFLKKIVDTWYITEK